MSKTKIFLKYWLPVLLWMAVIFGASSDAESYQHSSRLLEPLLHWLFPQMPQSRVEEIHHFFRKCGHFTEYAALALLLWRALFKPQKNEIKKWNWRQTGVVLVIVFIYAGSDEFHQRFVPTRTPHFTDVLIDTAGGAIALFLLWFVRKFLYPAKE